MAKYPDSIYEPRNVTNLPGIDFDAENETTFFAEDKNAMDQEIVAIEEALGEGLANIESLINSKINTAITSAKNSLMPVGTIYGNGSYFTNPTFLLGFGSWEPYAEGRAVVGKSGSGTFDTMEAEVGSETHTLTEAQLPKLTKPLLRPGFAGTFGIGSGTETGRSISGANNNVYQNSAVINFGGGSSHNNIQPSKVAALWIRVA